MVLTIDELVRMLRQSVNVQQEDSEVIDPAYLAMSDDDLLLYLKLGVSRAYPNCTLDSLPNGSEYPIMLLSKVELYTALAVKKADKVDMGADNNNYLKQSQRFDHYMKLAQSAKEQYESWLDNEGQGEVTSFDVLLDKRHYSHRNFEKQARPKVRVFIDSATSDSVEYHWTVTNTSHFARFKVYLSVHPIVDTHKSGFSYSSKIDAYSKCVLSTGNIRNTEHRITKLEPNMPYYIAVISLERNQVWGYDEVTFCTLPVFEEDEDDFDIEDEYPDKLDTVDDSSSFSGEDSHYDKSSVISNETAVLQVSEYEDTVTKTVESGGEDG